MMLHHIKMPFPQHQQMMGNVMVRHSTLPSIIKSDTEIPKEIRRLHRLNTGYPPPIEQLAVAVQGLESATSTIIRGKLSIAVNIHHLGIGFLWWSSPFTQCIVPIAYAIPQIEVLRGVSSNNKKVQTCTSLARSMSQTVSQGESYGKGLNNLLSIDGSDEWPYQFPRIPQQKNQLSKTLHIIIKGHHVPGVWPSQKTMDTFRWLKHATSIFWWPTPTRYWGGAPIPHTITNRCSHSITVRNWSYIVTIKIPDYFWFRMGRIGCWEKLPLQLPQLAWTTILCV